jgi:UDP-2,4-diacetamido-2,4,6-trideoxy-beta-L-altropyranose hydrolase
MLAAIGPVPARSNKSARLRLASLDDEAWLLALQRKPETRRFANDPAAPSADDHHRWLDATLSDPQRLLTIVEVEGRRAAMLRLDSGVDADRINIAVDPNYHRQGIGAAALELAARLLPGRTLEAEILSENAASLALFLGAGYRRDGERLFRRGPA